MDEVWMLDYLNAVYPWWGVFESEQDAYEWVRKHSDEKRWPNFTAFKLTVNRDLEKSVDTTSPEHSYRNQR